MLIAALIFVAIKRAVVKAVLSKVYLHSRNSRRAVCITGLLSPGCTVLHVGVVYGVAGSVCLMF